MCTTPDRNGMFTSLYNEIQRQIAYMDTFHPTLGVIQVLVDDSKKFLDGGLSIGKKREALLKRADGKYICYLDSDESVSPNYVETIVRLCQEDKDVCTFRSIAKLDNYWAVIDMRLDHPEDEQASPNFIVHRRPWHINAIRSEIAKQYFFPDTNYSEDSDWMTNVRYDLRSEAHTDAIIHQYNHSLKTSEADKITKAMYV